MPHAPQAADFSILDSAARDAEQTVAACLAEMRGAAQPVDVRAFSLAVATLRRLVDMRAALGALTGVGAEEDDGSEELARALEAHARRRARRDDEDFEP